MTDWRKGFRDTIGRDVARRHPAAEPSDPPLSDDGDPRQAKREARALLPWGRRFIAWITDFHKFVTALVSIAAVTVAIHVWLKGLITRKELEIAVTAAVTTAVTQALLDMRTDVVKLKEDSAWMKDTAKGLPEWKVSIETRVAATEHQGEKNEKRIDAYLVVARSR